MTAVVDASVVIASLTDNGPLGTWSRWELDRDDLVAPHLMPVEVANGLRRGVMRGRLSADSATLAHFELSRMPVQLFSYEQLADRVWELRDNLSPYDAWYVALAESLNAPLVTLDVRSSRGSGPRCEFRLPPDLVADPS